MQEVATLRDPSLTSFQVLMTAHTPPNPNPSAKDVAAALDSYRTQALTYEPKEDLMVENDVVSQDDTAAQAAAQAAAYNQLLPTPSPTPPYSPPHDLALCLPSGQRTRLILCA